MQFKTFLQYQCYSYWLRWRWLAPIFSGLLLGYWANNVIDVLNSLPLSGDLTANVPGGNALEAFIWAFGKPEIVYFVITAVYVYLVSDYLPAAAYEQWILTRLGSRSVWWVTKVSLVLFSTLLYGLLLFSSFFMMVLSQYPLSVNWSPAALNDFGMGLGYAIKNGGPLQGALLIALFLMLGWFAIGLLVLTINQVTRKSWAGFLGGAIIVVVADLGAITGGPIGGQGWWSYLLIQNHLEYTPLWAPVRSIPESASWVFWLTWILLCYGTGWLFSKRVDIFAIES